VRRFPWDHGQSAGFVLTAAQPLWGPVRRSIRRTRDRASTHQAITLTLKPWVSYKTMANGYGAAQLKMLRGRENRSPSRTNLEVVQFWCGR